MAITCSKWIVASRGRASVAAYSSAWSAVGLKSVGTRMMRGSCMSWLGAWRGPRRVLLPLADDQYRAWRVADHLLRDRAHHDVRQPGAAVGADDDQVVG